VFSFGTRPVDETTIVARVGGRTLVGMSAVLTSRLHVDLQRVSSAICSCG
jgi:hypothetical protein